LLGISLLNEISPDLSLEKPSEILNMLRYKVKNSLRSNQYKAEQYNGLDMAICRIDTDTNVLTFSGAYNSVYIMNSEKLIELKGDRQPIGSFVKEKPFKDQHVQLQSGDKIYFSSDGYADQFGGGKHLKRYQSRNLKKLLGDIVDKPLSDQKDILLKKHIEWKGDQDQVDDILVLGLELPVSQAIQHQ